MTFPRVSPDPRARVYLRPPTRVFPAGFVFALAESDLHSRAVLGRIRSRLGAAAFILRPLSENASFPPHFYGSHVRPADPALLYEPCKRRRTVYYTRGLFNVS